jgi:hypothetical protein
VTPDSSMTLVVRSSPRVAAPDWRNRIRQTPVIVWIAVAFVIVLIVLRGPAAFPGIWIALVLIGLLGGAVLGAKALNARVVITPEYVESRDALRRSQRCDRALLTAWVVGRSGSLTKVFLVDQTGRTRITLAWDSYSDSQLDQIRGALDLPKADNPA